MKKSPWCNLKTVGHCRYINHADDGSDNHHGDGDDCDGGCYDEKGTDTPTQLASKKPVAKPKPFDVWN